MDEMETSNLNFKSVLCNDSAPNDIIEKEKVGGLAGATSVNLFIGVMPSPMTENGNIGMDGDTRKESDMVTFMSLFGFVTGKKWSFPS